MLLTPQPAAAENPVARGAMLTIAEEVEVSAATAGVLRELLVREGSLVAAGDVLMGVDDRQARLAEQRAGAQLKRAVEDARSDLAIRHAQTKNELARSEHERALAIDRVSPASVSDRELERLRLAAAAANLDVERAAHDRRMAELHRDELEQQYRLAAQDLADCTVAAPIAGLVVRLHKRAGEWVDRGEPVVTLVRVDRLRAEALLPVESAPLDLVGRPAVFRYAGAAQAANRAAPITARGTVVFVSPRADTVTSLARVWVELPVTHRRLRPGLRGEVEFLPPQPSAEASVPQP